MLSGYRLSKGHGTAFIVQIFECVVLTVKQAAEYFQEAVVMPSQLVAHGKSPQHIDGVFPKPCAGFCLIDIAVGSDARCLPHSFQIYIIGSIGLSRF